MKLRNIFGAFSVALLFAISACEPIEDRDVLSNSFDLNSIDLQVVQATEGGNKLSIQMNTPGVTGYWDYIIDSKYTDRVEVVFPFTGTHEFTYNITTPYMPNGDPAETEFVQKTISVEITQLDEALPQAYYDLVGQNLEGKSWVFDGTGGDDQLWWFMCDPGNPWGLWWNAGGTCCPPADVAGKMVFDLAGAANYTYYTDAGSATGELGSFSFNGDYTKMYIGGGLNILGAADQGSGNVNGEYQIVELTADRLVLFTPTNSAGTGWTWVFKPE